MIVCLTHALLALACVPLIREGLDLPATFWMNMSLCAVLAVASNVLLVQAVKLTDLSLLGPINAWKPVVSLVPGIVLLREVPAAGALAGIGLVIAGSSLLTTGASRGTPHTGLRGLLRDAGVQLRLAALVLSGVEAVFLKRALLASWPLVAFAWWAILGLAASFASALLLNGREEKERISEVLFDNLLLWMALAATTGLMQASTLFILADFQVGPALALFQTSAIVSVLLGSRYFGEPHVMERLAGSAVMTAGAALIVVCR